MKPLLLHRYEVISDTGLRRQILSIFIVCHNLSSDEFDTEVAAALGKGAAPNAVCLTGYHEDIEKIHGWLTQDDNVTIARLQSVIGKDDDALCFISFEANPGAHVVRRLDFSEIADSSIASTDRQLSLLAAFRAAGGEQRAPVGTHFEKTSDSHSDRFLRVSNVLEDGANVRLIAFWLLPHIWNRTINSVMVDTSGIYSIALTAIHEAYVRSGLQCAPLVWSHRSHEGVSDIATHQASAALCLISASTSGSLAHRLSNQGAHPDRIVTLFSLSKPSEGVGHVLCDLTGQNGEGIKRIDNYKKDECPLCQKHYHLIRIQGDQFSPSPPNVTLLEIAAKDLKDQIKEQAASIIGLGAFVAYRRGANERTATFGLIVDPILNAEVSDKNRAALKVKRDRWAEYKRRSSSVSIRHVVANSSSGSLDIANDIALSIRHHLRDNDRPIVVTPEELRSSPPKAMTSTIVVVASIDEAKELLSVSRTLRDVQEDGTTSYLAVADLMCSKMESDRLRSNLTFGQHGPGTFNLHTLFCLPLDCYEDQPSWEAEAQELKRIVDWADACEIDVPTVLEERIRSLKKAPATGLIEKLFWPAADGNELTLRSDFTLITDARQAPHATQADLFSVIGLVLTSLRHDPVNPDRRLAQNAYERVVLSPSNFDRFNDGILQASLLRAAHPQELAYGTCDISVSEQMLGILIHALPDEDVPEKSEALMEFLIALLTHRLSLHQQHLLEFCERVVRRVPDSDIRWLVASYLIDREKKLRAA